MENVASFEPKSLRPQVSRFIYVLFIIIIIIITITVNNTVKPSQEIFAEVSRSSMLVGHISPPLLDSAFSNWFRGWGSPLTAAMLCTAWEIC